VNRRDVLGALALIGLITGVTAWMLGHLGGFQWDADEGINLMKALMLNAGYPLYSRIWADQPPGFTVLLAMAFCLFGTSVEVGRALTALHSAVALLAVAWLVGELGGNWLGALAAVGLLAIAPNFFWAARAVMIGLPALALTALAVAAALAYARTGQRRWLVVAGLVFAAGLLEKLIYSYVALPIALAVAWRRPPGAWLRERRAVAGDLVLLGASGAVPILLTLLAFDPRAMLPQVVGIFLDAQSTYTLRIASNWGKLTRYLLIDNFGLLGLAGYGLAWLVWQRSRGAAVVVSWLALTVIALLTHVPIWPKHHFLPLLLLACVLAGLAVSHLARALRDLAGRRFRPLLLVAGALAVALCVAGLDWMLAIDGYLFEARSYETKRTRRLPADRSYLSAAEAIRYLQSTVAPGGFIVTDYPILAFRAGLQMPPELIVISGKRVDVGALSSRDLIRFTRDYPVAAVVPWDEKLVTFTGFMAWLESRYRLAETFGEGHAVYFPAGPLPPATHRLDVRLGDGIALLGYDLETNDERRTTNDKRQTTSWSLVVGPSSILRVTLYWQALAQIPTDYTVFTHLVDATGRLVAQHDSPPVNGAWPTRDWVEGETVIDTHTIVISPDTPAGDYTLLVGMYDSATQQRLPVTDGQGHRLAADQVVLTTVGVTR
jgi:hypothetical protein